MPTSQDKERKPVATLSLDSGSEWAATGGGASSVGRLRPVLVAGLGLGGPAPRPRCLARAARSPAPVWLFGGLSGGRPRLLRCGFSVVRLALRARSSRPAGGAALSPVVVPASAAAFARPLRRACGLWPLLWGLVVRPSPARCWSWVCARPFRSRPGLGSCFSFMVGGQVDSQADHLTHLPCC